MLKITHENETKTVPRLTDIGYVGGVSIVRNPRARGGIVNLEQSDVRVARGRQKLLVRRNLQAVHLREWKGSSKLLLLLFGTFSKRMPLSSLRYRDRYNAALLSQCYIGCWYIEWLHRQKQGFGNRKKTKNKKAENKKRLIFDLSIAVHPPHGEEDNISPRCLQYYYCLLYQVDGMGRHKHKGSCQKKVGAPRWNIAQKSYHHRCSPWHKSEQAPTSPAVGRYPSWQCLHKLIAATVVVTLSLFFARLGAKNRWWWWWEVNALQQQHSSAT